MDRKETLEKALDAVTRRPKTYGPPEQNFERIARRWNTHLVNVGIFDDPRVISDPGAHNGITAVDVAAMMADMKLARLEETPDHSDSWTDLAGYAACGAEVSGVEKEESDTPAVPGAKFKVGDRIRLIDATHMAADVGAMAVVRGWCPSGSLDVAWDRSDKRVFHQCDGGYTPSRFELAGSVA